MGYSFVDADHCLRSPGAGNQSEAVPVPPRRSLPGAMLMLNYFRPLTKFTPKWCLHCSGSASKCLALLSKHLTFSSAAFSRRKANRNSPGLVSVFR